MRPGIMSGNCGLRASPAMRASLLRSAICALVLIVTGVTGCGKRLPVEEPPPARQPGVTLNTDEIGEGEDRLVTFYAEVEKKLVSSGRMRRETAPEDAPYTVDDLVRNFERIALYDEYADVDGRLVHTETPATLRRWTRPIRVGVMSGPSLSESEAARDRANVAALSNRLSRLTGLDIAVTRSENVNFLVLFMNESERTVFAREVAEEYPEFAPTLIRAISELQVDIFCTAYFFNDQVNRSTYSAVIVLIRAEHPPLTRLSCAQEEMAQAMGLPNDSPDARPSLFNDDLEFALLTEHDEILLRMLYDPRLRPGMTAAEVRPLLPEIARDAMAAQSRDGRVATSHTSSNGRS